MNYSLPSLSSRVRALINHPDPQWKKNNRRRLHPHQLLRRHSHPQSTTPTFPPPPHPRHEPPKQTPTPTSKRTSCSVITVQSFSASKLASRIAETPASTTKTGRRRSGTTLGRALSWCLLFGSSVRFALSLIFLNRSALNSEDWKWSWVVRMEVWFFFFFLFWAYYSVNDSDFGGLWFGEYAARPQLFYSFTSQPIVCAVSEGSMPISIRFSVILVYGVVW